MHKRFIIYFLFLIMPFAAKSQIVQGKKILFYSGISMGTSYYVGDLNPNYFPQINWPIVEPYFGLFAAHEFNRFLTARVNFNYAWVKGDDRFASPNNYDV